MKNKTRRVLLLTVALFMGMLAFWIVAGKALYTFFISDAPLWLKILIAGGA